jgi:hypothetical protein
MAMATTKGKMKQRSFYMDDETYALIERRAEQIGESNGRALRMIVRRHEGLDEAPAEPALTPVHQSVRDGTFGVQSASGGEQVPGHEIVLPPDRQETFKVPDRFKEKGPRAPKAVHSDDDF